MVTYGDHVSLDPLGERPLYLQLSDLLRSQILDGTLQPGRPVPSLVQLMGQYQVARGTAAKAVQVLVQEGLARIVPGKGAYVLPQDQRP